PFVFDIKFGLSDREASKLATAQVLAASQITVTRANFDVLVELLEASDLRGILTFLFAELKDTAEFGTIEVDGDKLVRARFLDHREVTPAQTSPAEPAPGIVSPRAAAPAPPADAPRLRELVAKAGPLRRSSSKKTTGHFTALDAGPGTEDVA